MLLQLSNTPLVLSLPLELGKRALLWFILDDFMFPLYFHTFWV